MLSFPKTYSLTRPYSLQNASHKEEEAKVGDMWLEDWPGPQFHFISFSIIDFMGSLLCSSEIVLWHFHKII
jgi:hypothetical protein